MSEMLKGTTLDLKALLTLLLLVFLPFSAISHPGGIDERGGHFNRRTGEYHFHGNNRSTAVSTASPQERQSDVRAESVSAEDRERRIYEYFRRANEGVALKCSQLVHPRDVSAAEKAKVLARDGHRCVTCGSTIKLEVDHRRALMNGGDNSEVNLATLCDKCHTAKTRMDNSLRRKREKLCKV